MRLLKEDKQAHHCNVQCLPKSFSSRSRRNWRKEKAFTGGYLVNHGLVTIRSQQRP